MKPMRIYVAGPYSPKRCSLHDAALHAERNVNVAIAAAWNLILKGHFPYVPHLTHFIHLRTPEGVDALPSDWWVRFDEAFLGACDAVLMLPNWRDSKGASAEYDYAVKERKRIFSDVSDIPKAGDTDKPTVTKPVVYLAGPIFMQSDAGAIDWRAAAQKELQEMGYSVKNPMDRDYRDMEQDDSFRRLIIKGDIEDVKGCGIVLASCPQPSVGTSMEIFYAYSIGKIVFAVVPDVNHVSPWLAYHSDMMFGTMEGALGMLKLMKADYDALKRELH